MLDGFIDELVGDWWVECRFKEIYLDPNNSRCLSILETMLRDKYDFSEHAINYVTELMKTPSRPTPTHLDRKGPTDSGIDVEDDETSVSAHIDGFDEDEEETDDEENEDDELNEEVWVKNIKSGNVYKAKELNPKTQTKPSDQEISQKEKEGDSQSSKDDTTSDDNDSNDDNQADQPDEDTDARDKAEADIKVNSLTALEKAQKNEKEESNTDKSYESAKQKVKELYGDGGKLLQNSKTSDQSLNKGFQEGKDWVARGNAGSNFNENMSNEASLIIEKYSDISESELSSIIFEKSKNTKLGKQQKKTIIQSPSQNDRGEIPSSISANERDLYRACIIAARSGVTKSKRANEGAKLAQEKVGFGKETKISSFGGTTKDKENLKKKIDSAEKIYVTDDGGVIEVPKDAMQEWVDGSGGGENASDTVVITEDENGNLIYDGWSDKKGFSDIQGNSTLNDDYTKQTKNIDSLEKSGRVSKEDASKAKSIVEDSKKQSSEIEKNYNNAALQEAKFLGTYTGEDRGRLVKNLKKLEAGFKSSGIKNDVADAMKKYKVKSHDELLDKLSDEAGRGKSSSNRLRLISRLAGEERKFQKVNGNEVPNELDTNKLISSSREKALSLQRETHNKLNEITGKTSSGKEKPLGAIIGFQETIDFLHLDKIKEADAGDFKQVLKRNTQLVMAGKDVTPKALKKCLGVDNLKDAEDNFVVVSDEKLIKNKEKTLTTGKVVYIYAVDQKDSSRKFIGEKRYRSRSGATGKTTNTIQWSPDMQKCFDK